MEQKIRRSIVNFQDWFNSPILSDINIHTSKSSSSNTVIRCHQIVIHLNSPTLLEALKNNKIDDNSYYIIEELLDKPQETELFLRSLYEPSVLGKTENVVLKGTLVPLIQKFQIQTKLNNLPLEIVPQANSDTPFSDFKLKIAGHVNYYNCHKLFLASSSEYFRGLFCSDMADKNSSETEIVSPSLAPTDIAANMELFIESIYFGRLSKYPVEDKKALFVGLFLAEQFLTSVRNNYKNSIMAEINIKHGSDVIHNAIVFNRDDILQPATGFLFYNVSLMSKEPNFSLLPKEYLESISLNEKNIVQACMLSSKDSATRNALKLILEKVGPNSPLKLQYVGEKGNTALHQASLEPKPKTLKFLLEQGLNSQLEVENAEGKTALEICLAKYQSTTVSKKIQRCVSTFLLYNATVRRRETNYEQLIKCAGSFPDFDPSIKIVKSILEEILKTDFEKAFTDGLTEALCANHHIMMRYFLSHRKVNVTIRGIVLNERDVTYKSESMRWSNVPSDAFKRVDISSKDAHTIIIDNELYDTKGATLTEETIQDEMSGHEFEETHLIFTLANGKSFVIVSQPSSSLQNLLTFYTQEQEPDSDEEKEKEHERVLNQISQRRNSNINNNSNNNTGEIDQIQMILMQGAQAASKIKKEKKKNKK